MILQLSMTIPGVPKEDGVDAHFGQEQAISKEAIVGATIWFWRPFATRASVSVKSETKTLQLPATLTLPESQFSAVVRQRLGEWIYPRFPKDHRSLGYSGLLNTYLDADQRVELFRLQAKVMAAAWLPARSQVYTYRGAEMTPSWAEFNSVAERLFPFLKDVEENTKNWKEKTPAYVASQTFYAAYDAFLQEIADVIDFATWTDVESQIRKLEPFTVGLLGREAFHHLSTWYSGDVQAYHDALNAGEDPEILKAHFRKLHDERYIPFVRNSLLAQELVRGSGSTMAPGDILHQTVLEIQKDLLLDATFAQPPHVMDMHALAEDMRLLEACLRGTIPVKKAVAQVSAISPLDFVVQWTAARLAFEQDPNENLFHGRQKIAWYLIDHLQRRAYAKTAAVYGVLLYYSDRGWWTRSPSIHNLQDLLERAAKDVDATLPRFKNQPITLGLLEACEIRKVPVYVGLMPFDISRGRNGEGIQVGIVTRIESEIVSAPSETKNSRALIGSPKRLLYLSGHSHPIQMEDIQWLAVDDDETFDREHTAGLELTFTPPQMMSGSGAIPAVTAARSSMLKNVLQPTMAMYLSYYLMQYALGWQPDGVGLARYLARREEYQPHFWDFHVLHVLAIFEEAADEMRDFTHGPPRVFQTADLAGMHLYVIAHRVFDRLKKYTHARMTTHQVEYIYQYILGHIFLKDLEPVLSSSLIYNLRPDLIISRLIWRQHATGGLDHETVSTLFWDVVSSHRFDDRTVEAEVNSEDLRRHLAKALAEDRLVEPIPHEEVRIPASRWLPEFVNPNSSRTERTAA